MKTNGWHAIMFSGNLNSFIQLFACTFLYCVLIQGVEQAQQNVTPNSNHEIKETSTTNQISRYYKGRGRRSPHDRRNKTTQLACYDGKGFQTHEYKIRTEKIVVNKTGEIFLVSDYVNDEGGTVTLCRKLILSDCRDGNYKPLSPDEYVVFPNFTVYRNATNSTSKLRENFASEILKKGNINISNTTQNSWNSTIAVCLPFRNIFNKTETKPTTSTTSYGLRIVTLIGFSLSTICHVSLLITYGLFQELRNVPGLNLMSLSFSMCLSQTIWLIGISHFEGTIVCEVFAVLEHYLMQVSFMAMSVISRHTYNVFSQPFTGRIANTARSKFIKYSAIVWLFPAVFVAICVILDNTETLLVDYGMNCWLGTANAKLYLFLLPLAMQLFYSLYKFFQTAVSLSRRDKDRRILERRKAGKQNLLICTKLATLVGFPWLFRFLAVLFPDVEAFEYLFVVGACLQGVCIALVFLFNKKILKLYKNWWNTAGKKINIGSTQNVVRTSPKTRSTFYLS